MKKNICLARLKEQPFSLYHTRRAPKWFYRVGSWLNCSRRERDSPKYMPQNKSLNLLFSACLALKGKCTVLEVPWATDWNKNSIEHYFLLGLKQSSTEIGNWKVFLKKNKGRRKKIRTLGQQKPKVRSCMKGELLRCYPPFFHSYNIRRGCNV